MHGALGPNRLTARAAKKRGDHGGQEHEIDEAQGGSGSRPKRLCEVQVHIGEDADEDKENAKSDEERDPQRRV